MRILLDTHVLLWALGEPSKLSTATRSLIEASEHDVLFSAASIWEIAIKAQIGRANFAVDPETIAQAALTSGFAELSVDAAAAARVARLPLHHRDPFDRILVAQALNAPATLLTADPVLLQYSELVQRA